MSEPAGPTVKTIASTFWSAATDRRDLKQRVVVLGLPLAAVGLLTLGYWQYNKHSPVGRSDIVHIELGGRKTTGALVKGLLNRADKPLTIGKLDASLWWDLVLIAGYGAFLIIGSWLAGWLVRSERSRMMCLVGMASSVVAIVADLFEDLFLALGFHRFRGWPYWYDAASAASTMKFCALLPAAVTAVGGVFLALHRFLVAFRSERTNKLDEGMYKRALPVEPKDPPGKPSQEPRDGALARWERGYHIPDCGETSRPAKASDGQTRGIGLSGGGIRAASVALGALQSKGLRGELEHTQHLVSISGGGYTAGAFVQALTAAGDKPASGDVQRDPHTAFAVGTPEEDHVRRHASYLADNPLELVTAIGLLARHLLLTLLLLFGPAVIVGAGLGYFYKHVPIAEITLAHKVSAGNGTLHFSLRQGTWLALAASGVIAFLLWLLVQGARSARAPGCGLVWPWIVDKLSLRRLLSRRQARRAFEMGATGFTILGIGIATVGIAIPGLTWCASWLLQHAHTTVTVGSPIATVVLTYMASLGSLISRSRGSLTALAGGSSDSSNKPKIPIPGAAKQLLLVVAALAVLSVAWLVLFGAMITVWLGHTSSSTNITFVVIVLVVLFMAFCVDESTLSMHGFYRARLGRTFAVRRVVTAGGAVAEEYNPVTVTTMSSFGEVAPEHRKSFPHVVFGASATLGDQRTPPGKNRVSYTMCAHWIGGPEVGYLQTTALEGIAPARLRLDMTVQAGVAISGAAVASSVGGQGAGWYETFLAISGVRLGSWLPNPRFVIDRYQTARTVREPGLPHMRRVPYLLRELFGGHSPDGALLQVTDGGFYDNLGLVELFRRGCTRIYVIDASGDSPPTASTLAQALAVAREELGVKTTLAEDTWSTYTPGTGTALEPAEPLKDLSARLSTTGIIRGSFRYPACGSSPNESGRLVVAKAALWPELPYSLLAYAQKNPVFPHDSTADQFFDDGKFTAYTELGRQLGDAALVAMDRGAFPPAPD